MPIWNRLLPTDVTPLEMQTDNMARDFVFTTKFRVVLLSAKTKFYYNKPIREAYRRLFSLMIYKNGNDFLYEVMCLTFEISARLYYTDITFVG